MYRSVIRIVDRISGSRWPGIIRRVRELENAHSYNRAMAGKLANLETIEAFLLAHTARLRAPFVLISQAQRSGGTLLSQLFDGHPEIAAHPDEIKIGYPTDEDWPLLDPADGAEKSFRKLFSMDTLGLMRRGYTKGDHNPERHRFLWVPRTQYRIFMHLFETERPSNTREILNHFFTSYFNAWLNYHGDLKTKRWITGFAPRLAHHKGSVDHFFQNYPDGRLIQLIRDPRTWYPSAKQHRKSYLSASPLRTHLSTKEPRKSELAARTAQDITADEIVSTWCVSAESICRNKAAYGDKVIVVRFEDLLGNTQQTMRAIARELGIVYNSVLEEPTFNSEAMRANSSFAVETPGVIEAPLKRQGMLSAEEEKLIEQRCMAVYERALAGALPISTAAPRVAAGS